MGGGMEAQEDGDICVCVCECVCVCVYLHCTVETNTTIHQLKNQLYANLKKILKILPTYLRLRLIIRIKQRLEN